MKSVSMGSNDYDAPFKGRMSKLGYYAKLAMLCCVLFALMESYLLLTDHGLLWKTDGVAIYFAAFVYEGKMLRKAVRSLLKGVIPQIPFYTFSEGYGADAFVTLSGSFFDPFNLLAPVFPTKYAEYGFYLGMLLRLIGTAWTFSMYCFHRKKDQHSTLVGSLAYATCGFVLILGLQRHPKFLNFTLLLPLAFMEADKLFEGERKWTLSILIAAAFICIPTSTYMICVMMLGYCLIKYFFCPRERSVKDFVLLVLSFLARIFLGFALGAVVVLPVVLDLLSEKRVTESNTVVPLLYEFKYYFTLASNMVGTSMSSRTLYAGIVPIYMVIAFVLSRKAIPSSEYRAWFIGLITVLVMILVPWFGSLFNGFNYVTDRWMPVASFCFAYIVVLCMPALPDLSETKRVVAFGVLCFVLLCAGAASCVEISWRALFRFIPFLCFAIPLLFVSKLDMRSRVFVLSVVIIVQASFHCIAYDGSIGADYADEFVSLGKAWDTLALNTPANAAKQAGVENEYRYSQPSVYDLSNGALALDMHGIDFCVSMYSQPVDDFRNGLELANNKNNHRFSGNDGRLAIDLLSGAKYFVAKDSSAFRVPYSYTKTDTSLNDYDVYSTDAALPVAFTYDGVISRETYETLGPIQRQEALLEGCIIEDAAGFNELKPTSGAVVSEYELTLDDSDSTLAEDGMFATSKGNCTITLKTTCLPKSETYLRITDLIYDGKSKQETADIFGSSDVTGLRARLKDALYKDPFGGRITVTTKLGKRTLTFPTPGDGVWTGRDDWCVNLGYSEEPIEKITITLNNRGVYTYRDLEVICQPVEPILKKASALQDNTAADITFGVDSFSATYTANQDNSLAFVSLPYSTGWTATVDGQKAEVLQADVGFMAVRLGGAGKHEVVFKYRTPGLVIGGCITLAAIVVFAVVLIRSRRKDNTLPPKTSAHMAME